MTFTYDDQGPIRKVFASWTSDSSGDAAATTKKIIGTLLKGVTDPGATAPTDDYDIVLTDEKALDILGECQDDLVDRDTSNTEVVHFFLLDYAGTPLAQSVQPVVCDKITVTVSNAGDTKDGQLILYYRAV